MWRHQRLWSNCQAPKITRPNPRPPTVLLTVSLARHLQPQATKPHRISTSSSLRCFIPLDHNSLKLSRIMAPTVMPPILAVESLVKTLWILIPLVDSSRLMKTLSRSSRTAIKVSWSTFLWNILKLSITVPVSQSSVAPSSCPLQCQGSECCVESIKISPWKFLLLPKKNMTRIFAKKFCPRWMLNALFLRMPLASRFLKTLPSRATNTRLWRFWSQALRMFCCLMLITSQLEILRLLLTRSHSRQRAMCSGLISGPERRPLPSTILPVWGWVIASAVIWVSRSIFLYTTWLDQCPCFQASSFPLAATCYILQPVRLRCLLPASFAGRHGWRW